MKSFNLWLLGIGTLVFTTAATAQQKETGANAAQFERDFVSNKSAATTPYAMLIKEPKAITDFNEDKYRKFKKMRTTGIVLTAVGAGLIATGIALVSNADNYDYYYDDYYYSDDDDKIVGGAVCIVTGFFATGGGITMWAIGSKKMKKYGGGSLSLTSSKSGMGVAYHF